VTASRPTSLVATLAGAGDRLLVDVAAGNETLPIAATGEVEVSSFSALAERDDALLTATVGPFSGIGVGLDGASGSGTLEEQTWGPLHVPAVPWSIEAAWGGDQPPGATVTLAGSPLELALQGGALELAGAVTLPVSYGGEQYLLDASVPGGRVDLSDLQATPLAGTLAHDSASSVASGASGEQVL